MVLNKWVIGVVNPEFILTQGSRFGEINFHEVFTSTLGVHIFTLRILLNKNDMQSLDVAFRLKENKTVCFKTALFRMSFLIISQSFVTMGSYVRIRWQRIYNGCNDKSLVKINSFINAYIFIVFVVELSTPWSFWLVYTNSPFRSSFYKKPGKSLGSRFTSSVEFLNFSR
jgi:hypothetical protein